MRWTLRAFFLVLIIALILAALFGGYKFYAAYQNTLALVAQQQQALQSAQHNIQELATAASSSAFIAAQEAAQASSSQALAASSQALAARAQSNAVRAQKDAAAARSEANAAKTSAANTAASAAALTTNTAPKLSSIMRQRRHLGVPRERSDEEHHRD
jgi:hypothetical protein